MYTHRSRNVPHPARGRAEEVARWRLIVAALALIPVVASAAPKLTDQSIADAIETELVFDPAVNANNIDVRVQDGIATLSGTVSNMLAQQRAAKIAEIVKGVQSVVNEIRVVPPWDRMDWEIQQDVQLALLRDAATEPWDINVTVEGGTVTLTGSVDSWQEKQLAGRIAEGVRGVIGLNNRIEINYEATPTDNEIKQDVISALSWDVRVDNALIGVSVHNGEVKLTGTVGSAAEKRQAIYDAWVTGVTGVDASGLDVDYWARDKRLRENKYVEKTDQQITNAVNNALFYDPRVLATNVQTQVTAGTVTLRGNVSSVAAKRSAGQDARNTVGVIGVDNLLKVRPSTPSDAEIQRRIQAGLRADPYVEPFDIKCSVVDGTAYLSGTVDTYFEKMEADDIAATTYGVTSVRNNIDVANGGPLAYSPYLYNYNFYGSNWYDYNPRNTFRTDAEIKEDIQDQMWWSPFVNEGDVNVSVNEGVATLTGNVNSWSEYNAATEDAYAGGATWVNNDLKVK